MNLQKLTFSETNQFSQIFLDYISESPKVVPFYDLFPKIENFQAQIEKKQFSKENRQQLFEVLSKQYEGLENTPKVNIELLLDEKTFTVTTGHQLNIFSGPLYFIYKIVTVINLAKELKAKYPEYNFVPVYWMASEDHDFDEICHFQLFGKKYQWKDEAASGAVGHLNPKGLQGIMEEIADMPNFFQKAYNEFETLADATRCYVNELFGDKGLVVVDADHTQLKQLFSEVIQDDLLKNTANSLVEKTNAALADAGYKTQIFPRNINFFYLKEQVRERIEKLEDGSFQVLNTEITFSEKELQEEITNHPERFSPNVVMRPVYQEVILPNIAYIGGPAEVAYWMQLKGVFNHYQISFPMVMPRNFALFIAGGNLKKLNKLNLPIEELFLDEHTLKVNFIERNSENTFDLTEEIKAFEAVFKLVEEKATPIDKSLVGFIGAEMQKGLKGFQNIEKRLRKAEERNQETAVKQIISLKERLFPNGSYQERVDNFLNFYLNDPDFLQKLLDAFQPLDFNYLIMKDE